MVGQVAGKGTGDPPELTDPATRDFIAGQLKAFAAFVRRIGPQA